VIWCKSSHYNAELSLRRKETVLHLFVSCLPISHSHFRISCSVLVTHSRGDDDTHAIDTWSKKEQETARQERNEELRAQYEEEVHPSRRWLHKFFVLVSVVSGIAAFSMGLGQFIGIAFQQVGPVQYVLRVYVIILCFLVILNELEWTKYTRESKIMRIWITRGMVRNLMYTITYLISLWIGSDCNDSILLLTNSSFLCAFLFQFYSFIGVLGLEENDTSSIRNDNERGFNFSLQFVKAVAWVMVSCGALYFFMGIFCLQIVYNSMRTDYEKRLTRGASVQRATETNIEPPGNVV
jgi:hypothetical protein